MDEKQGNVLLTQRLFKTYNGRQVLNDVSFEVKQGEIFVIMGGSGCGKSTLLRIMAGGVTPTSGEVIFDGKNIGGIQGEEKGKDPPSVWDEFSVRCTFRFVDG